jgi:ABC-type sugar transport system ATPase subunit
VVLISHNMPEVLAVSDRIEVLRLGRRVARFQAAQASVEDLVGAMTGAILGEDEQPPEASGTPASGTPGSGTPGSATDSKTEAGHDR